MSRIIKNAKTDYTLIPNSILDDKTLTLTDIGVLTTIFFLASTLPVVKRCDIHKLTNEPQSEIDFSISHLIESGYIKESNSILTVL